MAEYRVPTTTKVNELIADATASLDPSNDANLSVAAQAVITAGACDVDTNLSVVAQAAIAASHAAPTYDGVNGEVVFSI